MDENELDERFAVTIDEVVWRAVGFDSYDDELDAIHILKEEVENAEADIDEAKCEGCTSEQLQNLEKQLATVKQRQNLATAIRVSLLHEVDDARKSGNSDICIIFADKDSNYPRLRTHSVFNWLQSKFGISIPEWAPPDAASTETHSTTKSETPREDLLNGYQRVIEGLVLLLLTADKNRRYLKEGDELNQATIAQDIEQVLNPHPRGRKVPSTRTIKDRFKDSGVSKLKPPYKRPR